MHPSRLASLPPSASQQCKTHLKAQRGDEISHSFSMLVFFELDQKFSFERIRYKENKDINNEIPKLDSKKASQDADITSNFIKENANIFTNFHYLNRNKAVADCECPVSFKNVNFSPIYNKDSRLEEKTIDQLLFSLIFRKFTREYCIFKISP